MGTPCRQDPFPHAPIWSWQRYESHHQSRPPQRSRWPRTQPPCHDQGHQSGCQQWFGSQRGQPTHRSERRSVQAPKPVGMGTAAADSEQRAHSISMNRRMLTQLASGIPKSSDQTDLILAAASKSCFPSNTSCWSLNSSGHSQFAPNLNQSAVGGQSGRRLEALFELNKHLLTSAVTQLSLEMRPFETSVEIDALRYPQPPEPGFALSRCMEGWIEVRLRHDPGSSRLPLRAFQSG
jgi:hypothetical protein